MCDPSPIRVSHKGLDGIGKQCDRLIKRGDRILELNPRSLLLSRAIAVCLGRAIVLLNGGDRGCERAIVSVKGRSAFGGKRAISFLWRGDLLLGEGRSRTLESVATKTL